MRTRFRHLVLLLLVGSACVVWGQGTFPAAHAASRMVSTSPITPLHVTGTALVDASGVPVVLHGVNRSGTEYACIQGWGIFDGPSDAASVAAIRAWGANEVNIPLNEDCWLGINGVKAAYGGTAYQNAIVAYTRLIEEAGMYPVLSYDWGAPGAKRATGQPAMPDADHAPAFWTSVATTFRADGLALLRLQEEPYPAGGADSTYAWKCWAYGTPACSSATYAKVGFQSLMQTVRATGATNVVQVPGLSWANALTQFLTYRPQDANEMAVVDVYGNSTCGDSTCFDSNYAPVAAQMPLMAGEFGESYDDSICGTTHMDDLMAWFDAHQAGYSAWVWDTWGTTCADLSLILDYNGTPKSPNGVDYQSHLLSLTS